MSRVLVRITVNSNADCEVRTGGGSKTVYDNNNNNPNNAHYDHPNTASSHPSRASLRESQERHSTHSRHAASNAHLAPPPVDTRSQSYRGSQAPRTSTSSRSHLSQSSHLSHSSHSSRGSQLAPQLTPHREDRPENKKTFVERCVAPSRTLSVAHKLYKEAKEASNNHAMASGANNLPATTGGRGGGDRLMGMGGSSQYDGDSKLSYSSSQHSSRSSRRQSQRDPRPLRNEQWYDSQVEMQYDSQRPSR
ncbi:hypothetical protein BBP40_009847, partial [Aspergillus hancockii]